MSTDQALLAPPSPVIGAAPQPRHSRCWAHAGLAVALCALCLLHFDTAQSMVGIWMRSATFAHGFAIPPIAAWMIWRQRRRLAGLTLAPEPLALPAIAATGLLWLVATAANVQVMQQYCFMLTLVFSVTAVLGVRLARAIAFPLAYLLLAVPFGEIFIAPLIDFTASFTVVLLQLIGIPVFRENNFLSLPSGTWSVVEACSGLRYLIASLALGAMFAYLNYRSPARRLIFITISLILPVLANGVRASLIVLIGHWSNLTLAIGIDHLIYGWVFFGIVSGLLFWCGAHWRETEAPPNPPAKAAPAAAKVASPAHFVGITLAVAATIAIWPQVAALTLQRAASVIPAAASASTLALSPPPAPWRTGRMAAADWHALHRGDPQRWTANYTDGRRSVSLQVTWYQHQQDDAELLAPVARTAAAGLPQWQEVDGGRRRISVGRQSFEVRQSIVQAAGAKLRVWRWYRQDGIDTASPYRIKFMLAKSKLLGGDDSGAEIILAAAYDETPEAAERAMLDLLQAMLPAIEQGLRHVAAR